MAEQTIQDLFDSMSKEDLDIHATIIGAAVDNELIDDENLVSWYDNLPEINKYLIDFAVGNAVAEKSIKHDGVDLGGFLEHYGVKGMKWGVRRDLSELRDRINPPNSLSRSSSNTSANRKAARKAVRSGRASDKQRHLAALKSKGHRAINALSGDKTFWKRMAITGGLTIAAIGVPAAGAWVLPTSVLTAIGSTSVGQALAGSTTMSALELGQWALGGIAYYGGVGTAVGGTAANVVGNTARAVAGNTLINRSYEKVGKTLSDRQKSGRKRVSAALRSAAGISDRTLMQSDILGEFLEHAKPRTISDIMSKSSKEQQDLMAIVIASAIEDVDISGDSELVEAFNDLSAEQKNLIDFTVGAALADDKVLKHSSGLEVGAFLAHYGVKGMKWGVRRDRTGSPSLADRTSKVQIDAARARVKAGTGTLGDAHKAALKSSGHRVFNVLTGDKTYWRRMAVAAGAAAVVGGGAALAPAVLPAGALAAVGAWSGGTTAFGITLTSAQLASIGANVITGAGTTAAVLGFQGASLYNQVDNARRAVFGNSAISKNYEKIGREVAKRQTAGNARTRKVLKIYGSTPKKQITST